ncbi:NAD(P)H-binding protein [Streptomyces sp. SID161]|uniref:NAD(P)-dependent oxidoreductase n=1 Tax=Streptomyces sp. SID161 TaxID=2690251 RepID=UPI001371196D|nr:NAD(P)H-binding protein [Streptomyces sp. SID161]MYW42077.1 NAD(P)H-binding protein [Streptomyces sp. SID161]
MSDIVVFGAGGRAGRAVTAEARGRGYGVTAVVRDPARYPDLRADGVTVVPGDVTDRGSVGAVAAGHAGAVHAVSPYSGPEQGFDALDPAFFVKAADALLDGLAEAGVGRLVAVGLGANLLGADGRPVMDDPLAFPPEIRPFALAHTAGLHRLRERGEGRVDWVMLTPAGHLEHGGDRTGRYHVGGERLPGGDREPWLSYADLAVALVDEIERPVRHRTRVSVFNFREEEG